MKIADRFLLALELPSTTAVREIAGAFRDAAAQIQSVNGFHLSGGSTTTTAQYKAFRAGQDEINAMAAAMRAKREGRE